MDLVDKYISYIRDERRYSERTVSIYADVLHRFFASSMSDEHQSGSELSDQAIIEELKALEVQIHDNCR